MLPHAPLGDARLEVSGRPSPRGPPEGGSEKQARNPKGCRPGFGRNWALGATGTIRRAGPNFAVLSRPGRAKPGQHETFEVSSATKSASTGDTHTHTQALATMRAHIGVEMLDPSSAHIGFALWCLAESMYLAIVGGSSHLLGGSNSAAARGRPVPSSRERIRADAPPQPRNLCAPSSLRSVLLRSARLNSISW